MSSSSLSFKINANKTINVEYSFSPFYSLILYVYTLYNFVKIEARDGSKSLKVNYNDLNIINRTFVNNFEPEIYNIEDTNNNIKKLYKNIIQDKFDNILEGSDLYKHFELNENKDINEFLDERIKEYIEKEKNSENEQSTNKKRNRSSVNYSFYIYYFLMFEQFYNLKYILNDPNTLIILPVYINSTVNSIEEYINKMPIKEFGIKSIKKELINLIQSFKLKDNSSNSETITKYDNVFFLKCIYTKSNFTEEEYKENINTELLRLINVLKERFQAL